MCWKHVWEVFNNAIIIVTGWNPDGNSSPVCVVKRLPGSIKKDES
jgi:hypothetical protein